MSTERTIRQHWVPQMYLRQWGGEDHLAVAIGGRILEGQRPKNFAVQSYMYKFDDLTSGELKTFFDGICETWDPNLPLIKALVIPIVLNIMLFRAEKKDWDDQFAREFARVRSTMDFSRAQGAAYNLLTALANGSMSDDKGQVARMADFVREGLESYHCAIESGANRYFERAVVGDLSFMKDDAAGCRLFLSYIHNQFF